MTRPSGRILVVDDHPMCAMAIGAVLSDCGQDLEVVSVGALRDLVKFADTRDVALILLDLRLPDSVGLNGIQTVRETFPDCRLCIMSGQQDAVTVRQAMALGVSGFLPKSLGYDELSRSVLRLLAGETVFPRLAERVEGAAALLSPAEERVMQSLCLGLQNKQIAFELGISESTVKSHLANIFDKLRVTNRSQAIIAYELAVDEHDLAGLAGASRMGTS